MDMLVCIASPSVPLNIKFTYAIAQKVFLLLYCVYVCIVLYVEMPMFP